MSAPYVTPVLSFPGISLPRSASITRSNSTRPGIALINAVPMPTDDADTSGTATLTFGTSTTSMSWTNCLCDVGSIVRTSKGFVSRYVILDRRWRWRRGLPVTGAYNVRDPANNIIPSTQRTLAQLATILFTACGESGADVSLITSLEEPFVVWDRDNPADELDELLESRGYVISLQADETVKVFPKGTGAVLPVTDDVATVSITVDPPEVPYLIYVSGNETYCQSMLRFVPVAVDKDGAWKLTQNLSFSPGSGATGFEGLDLKTFPYITDPKANDLARKYVGKCFQVDSTQSFSLNFGGVNYIPGEISVTDVTQILPLQPFILDTYVDQYGQARYQDAYVVGTFWQGNQADQPPNNTNTSPFSRVDERDWSWVDLPRGIIKFVYPAVKVSGNAKVPADVYVVCAYSVHRLGTGSDFVKDRYLRSKSLGGFGYEQFKVPELQRTIIAEYTDGTSTIASLTDNKSTVDTEADDYLNAAALRYVTQVGNVITYRDTYAFSTDGVNLQVQWFIGAGHTIPFATIASQYVEALAVIPTEADRRDKRNVRRQQNVGNVRGKNWKQNMFAKGP